MKMDKDLEQIRAWRATPCQCKDCVKCLAAHPAGKSCKDCVHVAKCVTMFGVVDPESQPYCQWIPSRFHAID